MYKYIGIDTCEHVKQQAWKRRRYRALSVVMLAVLDVLPKVLLFTYLSLLVNIRADVQHARIKRFGKC